MDGVEQGGLIMAEEKRRWLIAFSYENDIVAAKHHVCVIPAHSGNENSKVPHHQWSTMFAFDDLFRFTVKYPQLMTGDVLSDIQEEAECQLASKAYLGIFLVPLSFVLSSFIAHFHKLYPSWFFFLACFFVATGVLRFWVIRKIGSREITDKRNYIAIFVICCVVISAVWGGSVALFLCCYDTVNPLYLMVMATCGICAGSIASFGSFRKLVSLDLLLMILPLLVAGLWVGTSEVYAIIFVTAVFLVYMLFQANLRNADYWDALIKSHLFEAQAVELSSVNTSLAQKMEEQEAYQSALKVSKNKLRDIFDSSHDGIVIHDMSGQIIDINRTMVEMYNIVDMEVLDIEKVIELSAPDNSLNGLKEMIDKVMNGEDVDFEWHAKKQNSEEYFWVQINMRKINWQNEPIIFSSIRNIDEQKRVETERDIVKHSLAKSEAYLKALLENISKPIFCKGLDEQYVIVNRHFEALVNESIENIEGKTISDFFSDEIAEKLRVSDNKVKESRRSVDTDIVLDVQGLRRSFLVTKFPLFDENNELFAIGGICTDITEIKNAYEEMVKANKIKSDYLANMAHEFRTPMYGILSFARLAIKRMHTTSQENILSYLHMVLTSGEHLLDLFDNLIEMNQHDSDQVTYRFEEGRLVGELAEVVDSLSGAAEEKGVELIFNDKLSGQDAAGPLLAYDPIRIQQVVRNLIANAIKFSGRAKTVAMSVVLTQDDQKNSRYVLVKVTDQGSGIPEEEQALVFESYVRGTTVRTAGIDGSGLGLAICKNIIEDHGGRIWVEQNPDGGAVFLFTLPLIS